MKLRDFLENFILVAIVLVIIQTFVHELAIYLHWSITARNVILVLGFLFDLIFSIEFITRSVFAGKKGHVMRYIMYERGWVDLLSSLPLLIFDSGPTLFFLIFGGLHDASSTMDTLNVLKVVKAVRVTRILRLVRIIKIFGKIHNTDSKMAQHHTTTVSTTAVFTIVCTLIFFSLFLDRAGNGEVQDREILYKNQILSMGNYCVRCKDMVRDMSKVMLKCDNNVLKLFYKDDEIISRVNDEDFKSGYSPDDYIVVKQDKVTAYISTIDIHQRVALNHIESFFIIVIVVLAFMIIYTRHFAQIISDPVHILNKGLRKKNYNLQVKVNEVYSDHEIYRLVNFYNEAYLPAKLKRMQEEQESNASGLSMDDLTGFSS